MRRATCTVCWSQKRVSCCKVTHACLCLCSGLIPMRSCRITSANIQRKRTLRFVHAQYSKFLLLGQLNLMVPTAFSTALLSAGWVTQTSRCWWRLPLPLQRSTAMRQFCAGTVRFYCSQKKKGFFCVVQVTIFSHRRYKRPIPTKTFWFTSEQEEGKEDQVRRSVERQRRWWSVLSKFCTQLICHWILAFVSWKDWVLSNAPVRCTDHIGTTFALTFPYILKSSTCHFASLWCILLFRTRTKQQKKAARIRHGRWALCLQPRTKKRRWPLIKNGSGFAESGGWKGMSVRRIPNPNPKRQVHQTPDNPQLHEKSQRQLLLWSLVLTVDGLPK